MFKFFKFHSTNLLICIVIILISCENKPKIKPNIEIKVIEKVKNKKQVKSVADQFVLNDENAIPFFSNTIKTTKRIKYVLKLDLVI